MNPFWKFHLLNETTDWSHLNTNCVFCFLHTDKKHTFGFSKNYSITYVRMENFVCQYKNQMQN